MSENEKEITFTDRDVRIVYLPPMTFASVCATGRDGKSAEDVSEALLDEFIEKTQLKTLYPAARCFGFNRPDGLPDEDPLHGYERWISIPEGLEVPAPYEKKLLAGGLYAAHAIKFGDWDAGWAPLHGWVLRSPIYDFRWYTVEGVGGWLEEHLNFWDWRRGIGEQQLDLLLPIQYINA